MVATQKGIYEGLSGLDVSAALTRDNAAQMVWNALQATEVTYKYTLVSENGQLVSKVVVQDKAPATRLAKRATRSPCWKTSTAAPASTKAS